MKNINHHVHEYELLKKHGPLLHFDGSIPLDEWKIKAKDTLSELLGLPFASCDPDTEIEYEKAFDDFTEYRMLVQTEPGYYVPCHLLIPKKPEKPVPLTICLSGHGGGMHVALGRAKTADDEKALTSWHHRAIAPRSIREGRAALVVEARSFGESSLNSYGTSCTEASKIAILMGRTILGGRVWDVMAERFPQVDMSDIVCTGNSGGGTAAYYLACMDERITTAMPSCSICGYETSIAAMEHCMCNHVPGIRKYFEMEDLAGLIAPRKLIIATGRDDVIFPLEGARKTFEQIRFIYTAAGAPENCALEIGQGGHLNYAAQLWAKFHEMNG